MFYTAQHAICGLQCNGCGFSSSVTLQSTIKYTNAKTPIGTLIPLSEEGLLPVTEYLNP